MRRIIIMVKDSRFVFPHFWSSYWDCSEQTLQYFFVHRLVDCLTPLQELEVTNTLESKNATSMTLIFELDFQAFFWPWEIWTYPYFVVFLAKFII